MKSSITIFSLFLLFSCTNDPSSEESSQTIPKLISLTSTVSSENSSFTNNFSDYNCNFQYNNDKINGWTIDNINNISSFEFVYDENGRIIKLINNLTENGQTFPSFDLIEYNNDNISNIKSSNDNGQTYYLNYNFEYSGNTVNLLDQNSDNNNKTITIEDNLLTSLVDDNHNIEFEYLGRNLLSKTLDNSSVIQYTYDEKNNPFLSERFSNLGEIITLMNATGGFEPLFEDFNNKFINPNNILSLNVNNYQYGGIENQNYIYTYNSEGYPLTKNVQNQFEVNYNYE